MMSAQHAKFTGIPKCVKGKLYDRFPRSPLPYFEIPVERHVGLISKKNGIFTMLLNTRQINQTELSLQTRNLLLKIIIIFYF